MYGSMTNGVILSELDKVVYGHTKAKKALITAINRAKLRSYHIHELQLDEHIIEAKTILLIGGSGTGKTHLVRSLQEIVDFPLVEFDASQLQPEGSKGEEHVSSLVKKVISSVEIWQKNSYGKFSNSEIMSQTVVFIDEFDKLSDAYDHSGKWNRQTQSNLLRLLEDDDRLPGVTFILAGAFSDLMLGFKKDSKKNSIGFTKEEKTTQTMEDNLDDLIIKQGIIPELMGRITPVLLDELNIDHYYAIYNEIIKPAVEEELSHFYIYDYEVDQHLIDKIIDDSFNSGQGIRKLKKEIKKLVEDVEFNYENVEMMRLPNTLCSPMELYNAMEDLEGGVEFNLEETLDDE